MSIRHYYDPKSGAFFDRAIHGALIPKNSRPLSAKRYRALIDGRAAGDRIVADAKGNPSLEAPAAPSADAMRAALIARIKREAGRRIEAIAPLWRQINDLSVLAGVLPPEADEKAEAGQRRRAIEALRARSNQIELLLENLVADQLAAFDPRDDAHWPSPETAIVE